MADVPPTTTLTSLTKYVNAGNSTRHTITLYDYDNDTLAKASIQTLTLSLVNEADGAVINGRDAVDILDANGGTVSAAGVVTLKLQPTDNVMVSTDDNEAHIAIITWTWTDPQAVSQTNSHNFKMTIYKDLKA